MLVAIPVVDMAYLNIRDRIIETKIAYVGPKLSGKRENFARLASERDHGKAGTTVEGSHGQLKICSLDWKPSQAARFNDCAVAVKLVRVEGEAGEGDLQDLLVDMDGLVLVLDSDADALERNRSSVLEVQEALRAESDHDCPVVVQINKRDLPGAIPLDEIIGTLGIEPWPYVVASALGGDGVIETLDRALASVIATLGTNASESDDDTSAALDPNPLLTALKHVISASIAEQIAISDGKIHEKIDRLARSDKRMRAEIAELTRSSRAIEASLEAIVRGLKEGRKGWFG